MTVASNIALAISARLATIRVADGFNTDAGLKVYRGKRRFAADEVPIAVIFEGPDVVRDRTRNSVSLAQRYSIEAHAVCQDADQPNDTAHLLLEDLKRALFGGDTTLGRMVKSIDYMGRSIGTREEGAHIAFASIDIDVVFGESPGAP